MFFAAKHMLDDEWMQLTNTNVFFSSSNVIFIQFQKHFMFTMVMQGEKLVELGRNGPKLHQSTLIEYNAPKSSL